MNVKVNETRVAVVNALKGAEKGMTLAEISEKVGKEVKTGTTNAMVAAGILVKVGTRKVAKTVYVEVAEYALGNTALETGKTEQSCWSHAQERKESR